MCDVVFGVETWFKGSRGFAVGDNEGVDVLCYCSCVFGVSLVCTEVSDKYVHARAIVVVGAIKD